MEYSELSLQLQGYYSKRQSILYFVVCWAGFTPPLKAYAAGSSKYLR